MEFTNTLPGRSLTPPPTVSGVSNPMGNFYVRFSLNLEPNITAACIKNGVEGCVGILTSVKKTIATSIKKKTFSRLILHERVRDLLIATGDDDSERSILAAVSIAVLELKISDRTYLTFLLLVNVLSMVIGTDGLDAALKEELGENKEFSNDGDVLVSKEFDSELFTKTISLRIFGVFLLISTFMTWAFLTIKGNCYNNVEMNDGINSAMGGTTETFAQRDCTSCLSLTNEGIEEVLKLSSKQLSTRLENGE